MSREELEALVSKIVEAAGTEEQIDAWVSELESAVPHPNVSDLIFYPVEKLTPKEIVEKAMSYKPVQL